MQFHSDFKKSFTTTITRAVGPTTVSGARPLTDAVGPYVHMAANGSDTRTGANPTDSPGGTGPVATIAKALLQMIALGRTTILIVRDGFVGDMSFDIDANIIWSSGEGIQVELGEIAEIKTTTTNYDVELSEAAFLNGIHFSLNHYNFNIDESVGSGPQIVNCYFEGNTAFTGTTEAIVKLEVYYTYMKMQRIMDLEITTGTQFDNCIFVGLTSQDFLLELFPANGQTVVFTRCLFANARTVINTSGKLFEVDRATFDFRGCDFIDCDHALESFTGTYFGLSFDYCHGAFSGGFTLITSSNPDIEITVTNQIDNSLPSLFQSVDEGINGDPEGFRLQAKGKATPDGSGRYFINSPLIDAYIPPDEDVNPWDEFTVLANEIFNDITKIIWDPKSFKIPHKLINRTQIFDRRGNPHSDYDAMRKAPNFTFNSYTSNENIWNMAKLMMDKGTIKFYPLKPGQTVFTNSFQGVFDGTDKFTPIGGLNLMIQHHWSGWWINFDSKDYYILANDKNTFTLVDKLLNGFPAAGTFNFSIEYFLVQPDMNLVDAVQEFFTDFELGGTWMEKITETSSEALAFEYNGLTAKFHEVEDREENV